MWYHLVNSLYPSLGFVLEHKNFYLLNRFWDHLIYKQCPQPVPTVFKIFCQLALLLSRLIKILCTLKLSSSFLVGSLADLWCLPRRSHDNQEIIVLMFSITVDIIQKVLHCNKVQSLLIRVYFDQCSKNVFKKYTLDQSLGFPISWMVDGVYQQSPTFLAPGTGFVEDSFSTDRQWGLGAMVQAVIRAVGSPR